MKTLAPAAVLLLIALAATGCPPAPASSSPGAPAPLPEAPSADPPARLPSPDPESRPEAPPATDAPPAADAQAPAPAPPPAASDATQGTTGTVGTIEGRVAVVRAVEPPKPIPVKQNPEVCGAMHDPGSLLLGPDGGLGSALVHLKGDLPAWNADPKELFELDQKACHYVPRILIVPLGHPVGFRNSDTVLHNTMYSSLFNGSQNFGIPAGGRVEREFRKPEVIPLRCAVHPFMGGVVVAAEHRFYTLTDAQGSFRLANVPPGTYKLCVWHETLKKPNPGVSVTVSPGATVQLVVKYE